MEISRRELEANVGAAERIWAPRVVRAENGPASGRRQIDLRRLGGLEVTLEPDQFLDLGEAAWLGRTVSFAPPSTSIHAESWGRRWLGGLLTTCGLTAVGKAEPADGGMHGRAHLVSSWVTRAEGRWEGDRFELEVSGRMREGGVFEQNLTVDRSIRATIGQSKIRVTDVVRNEGFVAEPVKLLYHINLGWPLVHAGASVAAAAAVPGKARTDSTGHTSSPWKRKLKAPAVKEPEVVDALVAASDDVGWSSVVLHSTNDDVTVKYRTAELPYLTIWRSEAAGSYALGIEPGTCWPSHVEGPRSGKVGRTVEPGESFTTDVEITFSKHR